MAGPCCFSARCRRSDGSPPGAGVRVREASATLHPTKNPRRSGRGRLFSGGAGVYAKIAYLAGTMVIDFTSTRLSGRDFSPPKEEATGVSRILPRTSSPEISLPKAVY